MARTPQSVLVRSVLLFLLSVVVASAQAVSTAQLNGSVKDSGGLALPGQFGHGLGEQGGGAHGFVERVNRQDASRTCVQPGSPLRDSGSAFQSR